MVIRRAMYSWLLPAAFVLPVWLLIGWAIFNQNGFALLPVLLIFAPAVFVSELVLMLLVRSRPGVRAQRALSWWDVAGFGIWHLLTIGVGFYAEPLFALNLVLAILAAVGVLWLCLWQLWTTTKTARTPLLIRETFDRVRPGGAGSVAVEDIVIVEESRPGHPAHS